ncbi:MAG: hypothetical protein ACRDX9_17250 [Acidimicrobiia bacterium]
MVDEKTLARYGYTGFHDRPAEKARKPAAPDLPYTGMGEKLGTGAPQNKALYLENLESKTRAELQRLVDLRGLEVQGTGAAGNVLKDDLIQALHRAG